MTIWTVILLAGVGSFLLRLSFLALVRGDQVPDLAQRALRLVPAAVLAALVVPAVTPSGDWTRPVAAVVAGAGGLAHAQHAVDAGRGHGRAVARARDHLEGVLP